MVKTVERGNMDTVVALDGDEVEVVFPASYKGFALLNNGSGNVTLSAKSGKTAADDGVRVIGAGGSGLISTPSLTDTVYVTGTGTVQISALTQLVNPFGAVAQASGGSGTTSDYVLPPATTATLGGVIIGDGLNVNGAGKASISESKITEIIESQVASDSDIDDLLSGIFNS